MFTGIIESLGTVRSIESTGSNRTFWIQSPLSTELKIDQSISHNGACLTVEEVKDDTHRVTAIEETLQKTNLDSWQPGTGAQDDGTGVAGVLEAARAVYASVPIAE